MFIQVLLLLPLWAHAQSTTAKSPTISLPWNTYTATSVSISGHPDIYKFSNVRFADAPTSAMRFGAPSTPTGKPPPDPTGAIRCHAVNLAHPSKGLKVPYFGSPAGVNNTAESEDCLFLDIYVPAPLLAQQPPVEKVAVIVWFYGGAYVDGQKATDDANNPFYTGVGVLNAANAFQEKVIFVSGNYRLGAFGWLAGSYMESKGQPNAGLLDQHLILDWVQRYISQVGGDALKVSAWGESAGAGSILHHLVLDGGRTDPLFTRAILQSPAYELQWDRKETLNQTYNDFAGAVPSCPSLDIECLRSLPINDQSLIHANSNLIKSKWNTTHQIPLGPAVDGKLIQHLPAYEFAQGSYFKGLDSILISHVQDEAKIFVPTSYTQDKDFTTFVSNFIPQSSLSSVRDAIFSWYPPQPVQKRLNLLIRDSSFTCNTRQLFDVYQSQIRTYMMQYWVGIQILECKIEALHGTDLLPTFWNDQVDFQDFLTTAAKNTLNITLNPIVAHEIANFFASFAPHYQSYLVSHAIFGDPMKGSYTDAEWPTATTTAGGAIISVQQAQVPTSYINRHQFKLTTDLINTPDGCDHWNTFASQVESSSMNFATSSTTASTATHAAQLGGKPLDQESFDELK